MGQEFITRHNFVTMVRPDPTGKMLTSARGSLTIFLFNACMWTAILLYIDGRWYLYNSIESL